MAVVYVVYADALHSRYLAPVLHLMGQEVFGDSEQALGVSVNVLKDYDVETAGDFMSLLVRLENGEIDTDEYEDWKASL